MKPKVFYEGGSWLVWTADEIESLRSEAKVIGEATMTAPFFPKQSKDLSLPIELTPYEAKWCFENGFCSLVSARFKIELNSISPTDLPKSYEKPVKIADSTEYDVETIGPPDVDSFIYNTYCDLKQRGYWIGDGKNYGCHFTIYKMEPWKCHSSALAWCEDDLLDTRQLIQHVRIAEATRKKAIAAIKINGDSIKYIIFNRFKIPDETEEEVQEDDSDE